MTGWGCHAMNRGQPRVRIDPQSATWRSIEEWATAQLERNRLRNEGELDPIQTAKVRGRIATLKDLLALAQPAPTPGTDEQ